MNVVVTAAHVYIYLHTYSISLLPPIARVLYSFLNVLQALNGRLHVPLVDTLAFIVFTGSMLKHDGPQLEPAPYKTPAGQRRMYPMIGKKASSSNFQRKAIWMTVTTGRASRCCWYLGKCFASFF